MLLRKIGAIESMEFGGNAARFSQANFLGHSIFASQSRDKCCPFLSVFFVPLHLRHFLSKAGGNAARFELRDVKIQSTQQALCPKQGEMLPIFQDLFALLCYFRLQNKERCCRFPQVFC